MLFQDQLASLDGVLLDGICSGWCSGLIGVVGVVGLVGLTGVVGVADVVVAGAVVMGNGLKYCRAMVTALSLNSNFTQQPGPNSLVAFQQR